MEEAESQKLFLINQNGINLEKTNHIKPAIEQYEWCVERGFDGNYPYDRLRIFYTKHRRFDDAIRVCNAFVEMADELLAAVVEGGIW